MNPGRRDVDAPGFETFTGNFICFDIPKGGANGEFAAELRHRTVDRNTTHNGNLTRFLGLPFHVEKDFESAALHNNLNFVDELNVKSSYLLCGNSMQQAEKYYLKYKSKHFGQVTDK